MEILDKALEKLSLEELIEILGMGTGNSSFELLGNFTHDFGWEAKWIEIISLEPEKVEVTSEWADNPKTAIIKLIQRLNNN